MPKYQVRYHRTIFESDGRVRYPSGTIIDSLDLVPAGQQDRVFLMPEAPEDESERDLGPDDVVDEFKAGAKES